MQRNCSPSRSLLYTEAASAMHFVSTFTLKIISCAAGSLFLKQRWINKSLSTSTVLLGLTWWGSVASSLLPPVSDSVVSSAGTAEAGHDVGVLRFTEISLSPHSSDELRENKEQGKLVEAKSEGKRKRIGGLCCCFALSLLQLFPK